MLPGQCRSLCRIERRRGCRRYTATDVAETAASIRALCFHCPLVARATWAEIDHLTGYGLQVGRLRPLLTGLTSARERGRSRAGREGGRVTVMRDAPAHDKDVSPAEAKQGWIGRA